MFGWNYLKIQNSNAKTEHEWIKNKAIKTKKKKKRRRNSKIEHKMKIGIKIGK